MSEPRVQQFFLPMDGHLLPGPSNLIRDSPSDSPPSSDPADLLRLIAEANAHGGYGIPESPKAHMERLLSAATASSELIDNFQSGVEVSAFGVPPDYNQFGDFSVAALRNSSKTLKCPKCNWHYKYQETLEIHMKEKHCEGEVKCLFCVENRPHPKLSRGETYSCGYKPYRCELCRYSTTTKGNLSIHMQSDKHLHAMQELPNSIASLGCQRTARSPVQEGEASFVCLVCGCFSCDSLSEMIIHAEKDRSRPSSSDVSFSSGIFRCHLCPYHTNLKANFQLHTRTDKHLQRVQLVNHIREGTNAASALCRLGAAKSVFQVLCRPCQEILPTGTALREHCEGVTHRTNLRQPVPVFRCRICPFETQLKSDALGHMACHDPTTWPSEKIELDAMAVADEDAAFACASCGFTAKDASTLEEHVRSHDEGELCPLCNERTTNITEHLLQDHKIAESAVEKLLQVHRVENIGNSTYTFRCNRCSLSFRTETALHSHSILHLFDAAQKCPQCSIVCNNTEELKAHTEAEHSKVDEENKCDLCSENFNSRAQFLAHINSVRHLHEAKKQLEQGSVSLNQQALLNPSSPGEKKPFRCNVCKIGYGQGATLDIHLRSVAHQSRMNKLGELVAAKEIDPTKPILEQPGAPPQKLIKDLLREDEMPATSQQNVMNVFNLMNMFMGQGSLNLPFGAANPTNEGEDDIGSPKNVTELLNMLRTFGLDRINAACPEIILKLGNLESVPNDQVPALCRVDCADCGQTHASIVLLGVHYQETHSTSLPDGVLKKFCEKLLTQASETSSNGPNDSPTTSRDTTRDNSEPPEKRPRSGPSPPDSPDKPDFAQMAMLGMMGGFPFMQPPFMNPEMFNPLLAAQQLHMANQSPAKRARTRISDDQLKILRQYFDINNSPSEAQIKEMSIKAALPEKVIKHWFRNTLFKERQRDKDSPYNFSVPPQVGIDLDTYEKTGETKVVPLTPEAKAEIKESESKKVDLPTPSYTLATMMQQMQNPFSFPLDPQALLQGTIHQLPPQSATTGRRANRTRFTDFQLRTLQQFFDKQAYPKDDDLEILSKKLQLSPRVIVVWFQNARQKARKIYENQPNHENSDRFLRTPGCNFQCKRCNLVFQRYYELIQHQQKVCYKDDGLAQANDNKGVEEGLTDDEKALAAQSSSDSKPTPADILKLLGGGKSSTEALLKMCESANLPTTPTPKEFSKRCPYCALLHKSKESLIQHFALQHPQQILFAPVDVDALPDAENIPILSTSADSGVLDLSNNDRDFSMSPFLGGQSDGDDVLDTTDDGTLASLMASTPARSPASNKRYRTHLTPVQVHVMKSVFSDYKTPSMSECESLGRDIGLHKRVVQVWFQNARAKERKTRASNGEGEEIFRSGATNCPLCNVEYIGRVTMQDHLFSQQHLSALKTQSKIEGNGDIPIENGSSSLKSVSSTLLKPKGNSMAMNGFPFQFMNGMMSSGLPMMFDQTLFGVPVSILQVPESVKEQIKSDMSASKSQTRFTHDGETIEGLKESLSPEDADYVVEEDVEVGWGCPSCSNVFQLESQLKNHQHQFCKGTETFTLVQTHYGCSACSSKFGSQREFISHTATAEHLTRALVTSSSS